jgi:hypothetical protein
MPQCADDAFIHFKKSRRPHQHAARRTLDVPRQTQRNVKTKRDRIGVSEFNLVEASARAENAQVRDDATARPDERYGFLRRKLSFLVKPLVNLQLTALAEQCLHCLRCEMAMTGADVHDERIRRSRHPRERLSKP